MKQIFVQFSWFFFSFYSKQEIFWFAVSKNCWFLWFLKTKQTSKTFLSTSKWCTINVILFRNLHLDVITRHPFVILFYWFTAKTLNYCRRTDFNKSATYFKQDKTRFYFETSAKIVINLTYSYTTVTNMQLSLL